MRDLDVTTVIGRWQAGDAEAERAIFTLLYDELHALARRHMGRERASHTLQPTAVVHEVYLRLVGERVPNLTSRAHLMGVCANLMRQILVNHAVARGRKKRGGGWAAVPLEKAFEQLERRTVDLVALDEALSRLSDRDPRQASIVELRFFGGLTIEETARAIDLSPRTVNVEWLTARAWLRRELES